MINLAAPSFGELYISLRDAEKRIYSDDQVEQLPEIPKGHHYHMEWEIRKQSCNRLIKYLAVKNTPLQILEVGCGNGWLSNRLSNIRGSTVTGTDVNELELEQAQRVFAGKKNLSFVQSDIRQKVFSPQSFDIIVFAASIQYFSIFGEIIQSALELLRPSGEIHILDTNFYKQDELQPARQRSVDYFTKMGFEEMIGYYHHHSIGELKHFNSKILFDPHNFLNRFTGRPGFYWIKILKT